MRKRRKRKRKSVQRYEIVGISLPKHLTEQGIEMWYWHVHAYDCPTQPLSQAFWRARDSVILHRTALPGVFPEDGGDLIVLLTQKLDSRGNPSCNDEVSADLIQQFYDRLMQLPFPHARILAIASPSIRKELIEVFAQVFEKHVISRDAHANQ